MSKENVADYTPIPTFETQEANGKETAEDETPVPASRRFRRTYFTRRDCLIVLVVVGLAVAAITVSLVFGLPALEAKRLAAMLNDTSVDGNSTTADVNATLAATTAASS